jgi:hypothetical protein
MFDASLEGRDLSVLIRGWISGTDDTQRRLVDSAIGRSHEAWVQAVADGLPESYPALRSLVDDTITRRLAAVPTNAFGSGAITRASPSSA